MKIARCLLPLWALALVMCLAVPALADAPKPCSLISKDEAAAILGEPVKDARPGKVVGMANGEKCEYFTAAPLAKRGGVGVVSLIIYSQESLKDGLFATPRDLYQRLRKAGQKAGSALQDVAGMGDEAYWNPKGNSLHILAKGVYLQLKINDLRQLKAPNMTELQKMVSEHRRQICEQAARQYILPKL